MDDIKIAWKKMKEDLKNEQPFKFIYDLANRLVDWLSRLLN